MILDGYAGAGGWDEGVRLAGLGAVIGIDNWFDACRTGKAAGHPRICADVSRYPTAPFAGRVRGLLMSPPCQAFSAAGKQLGKADQQRVHELVDRMAGGFDDWWTWPWVDHRSHHTAQPVRWVRDLRPEFVCLEQVPEVLPLWQHIGRVLTAWDYSVWVGCLNAADYGVPQTRKRAFLIASRARTVAPPAPTHYDPRRGPAMFDSPWVSMGDALGWTGSVRTGQNSQTNSQDKATTRPIDEPASTVFCSRPGNLRWVLRNGTQDNACVRGLDEPAGTMFFGGRLNNVSWVAERPATTVAGDPRIAAPGHRDRAGGVRQHAASLRVTVAEAAVLQSFRPDYPWQGTKTAQFLQVGNSIPPLLATAVLGAAAGARLTSLIGT